MKRFEFKNYGKPLFFVDLTLLTPGLGGGLTFIRSVLPEIVREFEATACVVFIGDEGLIQKCVGDFETVMLLSVRRSKVRLVDILNSRRVYRMIDRLAKDCPAIVWGPLNCLGYRKTENLFCVVTIHDIMVLRHPEFYTLIQRKFRTFQLNLALKNADEVISVSNFTKSEIEDATAKWDTKLSVQTIYEGIVFQDKGEVKSNSDPFLLFVGVGRKNKNLDFLIRSFDLLVQDYDWDGYLSIVGSISSKDTKRLQRVSAFPHRIRFKGFISDEDLYTAYSKCAAFVFPSIYEGFGLPPVEAYLAGAKVVASNIGAVKEVCKDFAILFDVGSESDCAEKIHRCLHEETLSNDERMELLLPKFDNRLAIENYKSFFRNILGN